MTDVITEIDIQAKGGSYELYQKFGFDPWIELGEFVDNAIGSAESYKDELKAIDPNYILEVTVTIDKLNNSIVITDNAAGIHNKDLERAFIISEKSQDPSTMNEHGAGMKVASFYFSPYWKLETKALGEDQVKTILHDIKELKKSTKVKVSSEPDDIKKSFTEITLEHCYEKNFPGHQQTRKKIKQYLQSMYRRFIDKKLLILRLSDGINEEVLEGYVPDILFMEFTGDPDSEPKLWKQEIDFENQGKKITGWVGLLDKPSNMNSGFDIIRRNKVIGSNDKRWRPDSKDSEEFDIFGSGHSNAKSRLFGELIFHNFGSDVNKSQIDWGVAGEWVKANFLEYLYKLIKSESSFQSNFNLKNSSNGNKLTDFWHQLETYINERRQKDKKLNQTNNKDIKKIIAQQTQVLSTKLASQHKNFNVPTVDLDEIVDSEQGNELVDEKKHISSYEFTVNETRNRIWLVQVIPYDGEGRGDWFEYEQKETDQWPKEISIKWDLAHPYSKQAFKIDEDEDVYTSLAEELFKLLAYLVIAEIKIKDQDRNSAPAEYFRVFLNKSLRDSS